MALHGHTSGVRVLISTQTAGTLSSSRFDQFVSEEQERFQEEWEPVEGEEGELQPLMNGGGDVFTGGEESSVLQPIEEGGESSTFPPLPPPNFDDLSPNGTLKSATQPDGGTDGGASEGIGKTDSLKAQQEPNTSTGSPTEASNEATPTSATTQGSESRETQQASNGLAMPVRRKSSNKTKSAAEGGEGKNSENEDTGTFRRLNTLDTAARVGQGRPSPVEEERESASPQPRVEVTPPPLYDEVTQEEDSMSLHRKRSPSPYEDPSTLHLAGPIPLRPLPDFFTTLEQSVAPVFSAGSTEGAVYVLTGARGFVSLQGGRKRSVQYIRPGDVSTSDESCIIAYELKH